MGCPDNVVRVEEGRDLEGRTTAGDGAEHGLEWSRERVHDGGRAEKAQQEKGDKKAAEEHSESVKERQRRAIASLGVDTAHGTKSVAKEDWSRLISTFDWLLRSNQPACDLSAPGSTSFIHVCM